MDIEDIRAIKKDTARQIAELLQEFSKQTSVAVLDVDIKTNNVYLDGISYTLITSVDIETERI